LWIVFYRSEAEDFAEMEVTVASPYSVALEPSDAAIIVVVGGGGSVADDFFGSVNGGSSRNFSRKD
jgi:hypothetical protein